MRRIAVASYLLASTVLLTWLILLPLIRDGMEISADSVSYISGSQNLLRGLGYVSGCPHDLRAIINFAPIYSLALAGLQKLGMDWFGAAQGVALMVYAALTALMFVCARHFTGSLAAAALAQIATAANEAILYHSGRVLSEPLSWVIVLLSLMVLAAEIQQVRPAHTLLLAGLLSAAVLVRFANIGFLLGAAIAWAVAAQRAPGKDRLRGYVFFTATVGSCLAAWLFRNWMATGQMNTGSTLVFVIDNPLRVAFYAGLAMVKILAHMEISGFLQILLAVALAAALVWIGAGLLRLRKAPGGWQPAEALRLAAFGYLAGYGLLILAMRTFGGSFILETRMLSPAAFLFILLAASFAGSRLTLPTLRQPLPGSAALAGLALLYVLCLPGYHAALRERSLGLYAWRDNQTLAYAASRLDAKTFITPDASLFLLWAGRCPQEVTTAWAQPVKASTLSAVSSAVVFLNREYGSSTILPRDITWDVPTRPMEFPDGSIYFFDP